jgi:long-subunit fatty acid transport protein
MAVTQNYERSPIASEARQSRIPLENNYWIAALRSQ